MFQFKRPYLFPLLYSSKLVASHFDITYKSAMGPILRREQLQNSFHVESQRSHQTNKRNRNQLETEWSMTNTVNDPAIQRNFQLIFLDTLVQVNQVFHASKRTSLRLYGCSNYYYNSFSHCSCSRELTCCDTRGFEDTITLSIAKKVNLLLELLLQQLLKNRNVEIICLVAAGIPNIYPSSNGKFLVIRIEISKACDSPH